MLADTFWTTLMAAMMMMMLGNKRATDKDKLGHRNLVVLNSVNPHAARFDYREH